MEILTGEQMRNVDRRVIAEMGIPGIRLMESAGRGVAEALLEDHPDAASRRIVILCGKGNNGGDGLVAGRHLAQRGIESRLVLLCSADRLRGDAETSYRAAREAGLHVEECTDEKAWATLGTCLEGRPIVLDAILGTGVKGGARGLAAAVIDDLNRSEATAVAVDLPSGLDADSTEIQGPAVYAGRTYTLCRPKLALVHGPSSRRAGDWRVIPIGIPDAAVKAEGANLEWIDAEAVRALLPRRNVDSHKGTFGHLLAVAGSRGKSGAAVLVGRAALRSGAGLVTIATPESSQARIAVQQAELMTEGLAETVTGEMDAAGTSHALALVEARDALAIGPGLGTAPSTADAVSSILGRSSRPVVIDADALNNLAAASHAAFSLLRGRRAETILTPHPGEAARLLSTSTTKVQKDRLGAARRLAELADSVVVLKGHRTLVADGEGRAAVNSTGNPGMATAGTGDILTGMIGAFLARGMPARDAARAAVFLHGDAGDRAAAEKGQDSLIASDLIDELPAALVALDSGSRESTRGPRR